MKNYLIPVLFSLFPLLGFSNPITAQIPGDKVNGEGIFNNNCAACHAGGNNVIMPEKTLKKDALEKNGMNKIEAITYQVTNGKNAMPAFGGRLNDSDIEDVATFVLSQSETDWE
jgi:cytochrome c6